MTLNTKVRLLQILNHLVSIPAVIYAVITSQYHLLFVSLAVWFIIGPISNVITLHRLLTHSSFKTYKWLENLLSLVTVISTVGPTMSWVAVHRIHHAFADGLDDPHSPNTDGKFNVKRALQVWWGYEWNIPKVAPTLVKDLLSNPIHKFIFNNYFKIIFVFSLVLLSINTILWVFAYAVPASLTVHLVGIVNVLGHVHGYRNYKTKDLSTNSWIANIFSMGDGWHNNHHANANKSYSGEKWWEWDLMGRIIHVIRTDK
jgi:stearoyl-CoA desaturase (delta-9 desaturase)